MLFRLCLAGLAALLGPALAAQTLDELAEPAHEWREKPHHVSVILGGTHVFEPNHTGFTIGIDYEYRVSQLLGLGGVVEYAFDEVDAWTLLAPADIHLTNQWTLQVGPGVEFIDVTEEIMLPDGSFEEEVISETNFVFRVGTFYEFKVGEFTIAPQVHYDITRSDALVFGIAIGRAF